MGIDFFREPGLLRSLPGTPQDRFGSARKFRHGPVQALHSPRRKELRGSRRRHLQSSQPLIRRCSSRVSGHDERPDRRLLSGSAHSYCAQRSPAAFLSPCYHATVFNFGKPKTVGDWIVHVAGAVVALFLVWWMLRAYVL